MMFYYLNVQFQGQRVKLTKFCTVTSQIKRPDRQTGRITHYALILSALRKKKKKAEESTLEYEKVC